MTDRDLQIVSALASGMTGTEAAEAFGISRRSVFRAASRVRDGARHLTREERPQRAPEATKRRDTNTSPAMMRAVVAALEERRVRPVGQRSGPVVAERCPRCSGRVLRERGEDGERDDACLACGYRPHDALTPEQHAAMVAERNGYDDSGVRRKQRVSGPRLVGGAS